MQGTAVGAVLGYCREFFQNTALFKQGGRLLAAVSGGPDSVVLLDSLIRLREEFGYDLRVCHVNHNLRGREAYDDERFVISLTENYFVPLTVRRFDLDDVEQIKRGNLEEGARDLRYKKLIHTAIEYDCTAIATGHTLSDQAETVLQRLLRGSGLTGLCGIQPVRTDLEIPLVRPLLAVSREDVMRYLAEASLSFHQDSMNDDPHYTRTRIRKTLLPLLKVQFNPAVEQALSQLSSAARDEEAYWQAYSACLMETIGPANTQHPAERQEFLALSPAEQRRLLLAYYRQRHLDSCWIQIEEILALLRGKKPQGEIHLSSEYRFYRRYNEFFFSSPTERIEYLISQEIQIPGITSLPELGIQILAEVIPSNVRSLHESPTLAAEFDADKILQPVTIRTRLEGDTIRPLGMGGTKKVKKILQEKKVSLEDRDRIPILCFGDEIAWVAGHAYSESFRVDGQTKSIVRISIMPM